jgi:DNA-binding transcriptional ArsR family regulator
MSMSRTNDVERLAAMFKALSHPQRLRMFMKLVTACCLPGAPARSADRASFCCAGDLGADLKLAASTVSHHLKELRQAGLMQVERRGQRIDCRVTDEPLRVLASFFNGCSPHPRKGSVAAAPARGPLHQGGRQ